MPRLVLPGLVCALSVGSLLLIAGCMGRGELTLADGGSSAGPSAEAIREVLRRDSEAQHDSMLVGLLRQRGLTPPFGSRFHVGGGTVAGFIPGRHPVWGRELVMLVARGEGASAAAALETARVLAARARYSSAPERTILVALLPRGGASGAFETLADAPLWRHDLVRAVVLIDPDPTLAQRAERVAARRAWPLHLLSGTGESQGTVSEALALARATLEAVQAAANRAPATPDVPPSDSTRADR